MLPLSLVTGTCRSETFGLQPKRYGHIRHLTMPQDFMAAGDPPVQSMQLSRIIFDLVGMFCSCLTCIDSRRDSCDRSNCLQNAFFINTLPSNAGYERTQQVLRYITVISFLTFGIVDNTRKYTCSLCDRLYIAVYFSQKTISEREPEALKTSHPRKYNFQFSRYFTSGHRD